MRYVVKFQLISIRSFNLVENFLVNWVVNKTWKFWNRYETLFQSLSLQTFLNSCFPGLYECTYSKCKLIDVCWFRILQWYMKNNMGVNRNSVMGDIAKSELFKWCHYFMLYKRVSNKFTSLSFVLFFTAEI